MYGRCKIFDDLLLLFLFIEELIENSELTSFITLDLELFSRLNILQTLKLIESFLEIKESSFFLKFEDLGGFLFL